MLAVLHWLGIADSERRLVGQGRACSSSARRFGSPARKSPLRSGAKCGLATALQARIPRRQAPLRPQVSGSYRNNVSQGISPRLMLFRRNPGVIRPARHFSHALPRLAKRAERSRAGRPTQASPHFTCLTCAPSWLGRLGGPTAGQGTRVPHVHPYVPPALRHAPTREHWVRARGWGRLGLLGARRQSVKEEYRVGGPGSRRALK